MRSLCPRTWTGPLIGVRGVSLFDGRHLDGRATTEGLLTHYVDNLEEGEGTFVSKLRP